MFLVLKVLVIIRKTASWGSNVDYYRDAAKYLYEDFLNEHELVSNRKATVIIEKLTVAYQGVSPNPHSDL